MTSDRLTTSKPKVTVSELPQGSENEDWDILDALTYSSRISHDQRGRSPQAIWQAERQEMGEKKQRDKARSFLKKLAKIGHASCFYQANFGLNYEVPRHTTLFLCSFDHSKFLQQSQRYTKAKEFISMLGEEVKPLFSKQRDLYLRMVDADINKEDARYILPLGMGATHLHQNTNFIALSNVFRVLNSSEVKIPSLTEEIIVEALDKLAEIEPALFDLEMIDLYNQNDKGYPVANLFSQQNKWVNLVASSTGNLDEPVDSFSFEVDHKLKSEAKKGNDQALSFLNLTNNPPEVQGYIASISLAAWHQFMRNDTVKNSVESIYDAADREKIVIPDSIEASAFREEYLSVFKESMQTYHQLEGGYGAAKAVEVIPHALEVKVAFSLDGFNLVRGFIKDRAQEAAQWEIRAIARTIKRNLDL